MLKQELVGEPTPLKKVQRAANRKNIREIRGIAKAYAKAPKYVLRLQSLPTIKIYVTISGKLESINKRDAKKWAEGFDNPEIKRAYWAGKLGVKLIVERV